MRRRQQAVKRMDGWRKRGGCHTFINQTHVFEHVHEAWSKAPGFVSVALKGADSDLGGALRGSSHHVDGVVHQSCFSLKGKRGRHHPSAGITNHIMHLSHQAVMYMYPPCGFTKQPRKLQHYFYRLHEEQSNRQPQPATRSTIWWAILFKAFFWLYTQSERNKVHCCILTQVWVMRGYD